MAKKSKSTTPTEKTTEENIYYRLIEHYTKQNKEKYSNNNSIVDKLNDGDNDFFYKQAHDFIYGRSLGENRRDYVRIFKRFPLLPHQYS